MALTDRKVRNAKPGRHGDGKGLSLLVKSSGAASWTLRVQVDGKRRDYGLGSLDAYTLAEAREKSRQWRAWAMKGLDPRAEGDKLKAVPTFRALAKEFWEGQRNGWRNPKHADKWIASLETYAHPFIGDSKVDDIDATDIQSLLAPIWLTKADTAARVKQRVAKVLDYAEAKGYRASPAPVRALATMLPSQKKFRMENYGHFPSMPYAELPDFFADLMDAEKTVGRLALAFLILTAARANEVRFARWSEVDTDAAEWHVPADKAKGGAEHIAYLSEPALAVLDEVRQLGALSLDDLIFPAPRGGALSDATMSKVLRVNGGAGHTCHGMRATFRTWQQEQCPSVPEAVAELSLAHKQPDKVVKAYARADFVKMRRDLMNRWGAFVSGTDSNVVRLVAINVNGE